MKKITKLSVFFALVIVQCNVSNAQILYNSAVARLTNTISTTSTASIVREYSANLSIICTYITPNSHPYLIMMDVTSNTPSPAIVQLSQMEQVTDMRIHNGYVFFCGISSTDPSVTPFPSNACYGFVDINVFWSATPSSYNVEYKYLDNVNGNIALFRMLVYSSGTNEKIVILGCEHFPIGSPSTLFSYIPHYYTYNSTTYKNGQRQFFILECTNPRLPTAVKDMLLVNSDNSNEFIGDMTLTDSYVAVIGYEMLDPSKTYIHKCDKNDVINTFSDRFVYNIPFPLPFNGYRCCSLSLDNIAIANLTDASGYFGIRTRFVDLQTMFMLNSQEFALPEKTEVIDMKYNKQNNILLMLTHFDFLGPGNDDYVFMRIKPGTSIPYITEGIVETYFHAPYYSMDMIGQNHFIATGGNYGFVKHVSSDFPIPACPQKGNWPMSILTDEPIYTFSNTYDYGIWPIRDVNESVSHISISSHLECVD